MHLLKTPYSLLQGFSILSWNETGSYNVFPEIPLTHVGNWHNFR